jgi:hypothetical protein
MNTSVATSRNFPEEELLLLETMAGLFFNAQDISIAMGWDSKLLEEFILVLESMDTEDILYQHYHKGRITAEIELRQSIKQAASNGSNPAQNMMLDFKTNSQL